MQRIAVATPDGRTLEVLAADSGDLPVIMHHGTPGAASLYPPFAQAAAERGLRLVSYSRPGYAGSTPQPGRTVASAAADVVAVLDALGADRFLTWGASGGGPHALACAALLPGRCLAAACIAGVAPYPADGLDWLAGMGAENVEEFGAALAGPQPLTDWLTTAAASLRAVTAEQVVSAFGSLLPPVDQDVLTGEFATEMASTVRLSVSAGIAGWRDDDLAFTTGWGFEVSAIERPVSIWQGTEDRMVPFAHGQWLAGRVDGASVHLLDGEGHLSLLVGAGHARMLDELVAAASA